MGSRGDSLRLEEKHEESHQGCVYRGEARGTENDRETENGERNMSLGQPKSNHSENASKKVNSRHENGTK